MAQRLRQIETVFNGRDNVIEWTLTEDGEAFDLSAVTRYIIDFDGTQTADSNVDPSAFDGSGGVTGVLRLQLGQLTTPIDPGTYHDAKLVIYTAAATAGIVWQDGIGFRVKEG